MLVLGNVMNPDAMGTMNCPLATSNCGRRVWGGNGATECRISDFGVGLTNKDVGCAAVGDERHGSVALVLVNGEDVGIGCG